MFYKRLTSSPDEKSKKVADFELDTALTASQKRHRRVSGWTKNFDLFSKDLVFVPICESSHWYLLIIVRPGLVQPGSEDVNSRDKPYIVVLDSMGGCKGLAVNNIRQYLEEEWRSRKCLHADELQYEFNDREMKTLKPTKPEQQNYSDCGLFLLHYVEKIFGR